MKKRTKNNLTKFVSAVIIVLGALVTNYFLDFSKEKDFSLVKENTEENTNASTDKTSVISSNVVGDLQVHYIDVGQGDSILVTQGEHSMLIDAGKNDTEEMLVNYIKEQGISKFDYIIGTHAHEDHIGGMDKVISTFDADNIFFPKQTSTTKTFENFVKAVKSKNQQLYAPSAGEKFNLGDASFEILAPNSSKYEEANDYSIVVKLTYKNKVFLFMGDAEELSENEILEKGFDVKCDVLKLGHHGSKTSTSTEFLEKADPSIAIVSAGKNNDYSHPSKQTMSKLQANNILVYRTDESGTIVLSTDGEKISSNVKEGSYNYGR